jgi:hypothetical protein
MALKLPPIPSFRSSDPLLNRVLQAVKESLETITGARGGDGVLTSGDLAGITARIREDVSGSVVIPGVTVEAPTVPTSVTATAGFSTVLISWASAVFSGFDYAEISRYGAASKTFIPSQPINNPTYPGLQQCIRSVVVAPAVVSETVEIATATGAVLTALNALQAASTNYIAGPTTALGEIVIEKRIKLDKARGYGGSPVVIGRSSTFSYTDSSVDPGSTYWYLVKFYNTAAAAGASAWANGGAPVTTLPSNTALTAGQVFADNVRAGGFLQGGRVFTPVINMGVVDSVDVDGQAVLYVKNPTTPQGNFSVDENGIMRCNTAVADNMVANGITVYDGAKIVMQSGRLQNNANNIVPFSEFLGKSDAGYWSWAGPGGYEGGTTKGVWSNSDYVPNGYNVGGLPNYNSKNWYMRIYDNVSASPVAGYIFTQRFSIQPGVLYWASLRGMTHRSRYRMYVAYYDAAGAQIPADTLTSWYPIVAEQLGHLIQNYTLMTGTFTPSSTARTAELGMEVEGAASTDCHGWMMQPFVTAHGGEATCPVYTPTATNERINSSNVSTFIDSLAVNTLQIADQAVTFPHKVEQTGDVNLRRSGDGPDFSADTVIPSSSLVVVSNGAPFIVFASAQFTFDPRADYYSEAAVKFRIVTAEAAPGGGWTNWAAPIDVDLEPWTSASMRWYEEQRWALIPAIPAGNSYLIQLVLNGRRAATNDTNSCFKRTRIVALELKK